MATNISTSPTQLYAWYLFDFAGSALVANGGLYFPQWLVIDNHVSALWYNLCLIVSTMLLLATGPVLGYLSDTKYGRLFFLRASCTALFSSTIVLFITDRYIIVHTPRIIVALIAFIVVLYSYQLGIVFYNALLGRVANPDQYNRISARGLAWGWAGAVIGILVILPFVRGAVPLISAGRGQAFLPAAILFGVLAFLSLRRLPDDRRGPEGSMVTIADVYKNILRDARVAVESRPIFRFLLSYLVFSDAILTIENNASVYLSRALHYSETATALLAILLLIGAAVGALGAARLARRVGVKVVLLMALIVWIPVLFLVATLQNQVVFAAIFFVVGVLFGALINASRVIYLLLIPTNRRAEFFGLYSSFERMASIVGPLIWSIPFVLSPGGGDDRYRISMVLMSCMLALSTLPLRGLVVPEEPQLISSG